MKLKTQIMQYAIEQERAEDMTHGFQSKLQLAMQASETGFWSLEIQTNRFDCDEQTKILFQLDSEVSVSLDALMQKVHPDDRLLLKEKIERCRNGSSEYEAEYRIILDDGCFRFIASKGKMFFDSSGAALALTGVCLDITEKKQQAMNMQRLALLEQREEFNALLAHDLRSPIVGVQRILSLMVEGRIGELNAEQKDLLDQILKSNSAMLRMITNVMDTYNVESGTQKFYISEMRLSSVVENCLAELSPLAQAKNIKLLSSINTSRFVLADQLAMQRVLVNLISNAIKFTPDGGVIEILNFSDENSEVLQVKDTGVGISPEDMGNIFQRFWQSTKKYRANGLGLGLYLCRNLVERQNGTIKCYSEKGKGSTFEIVFPAAPIVHTCKIPNEQCQVVLIEDDELLRRAIGIELKASGISFCSSPKGEEALNLVKSHRPQVLILDLLVPDKSGVDIVNDMNNCLNEDTSARIKALVIYSSHELATSEQEEINLNNTEIHFLTKTKSCISTFLKKLLASTG